MAMVRFTQRWVEEDNTTGVPWVWLFSDMLAQAGQPAYAKVRRADLDPDTQRKLSDAQAAEFDTDTLTLQGSPKERV